MNKWVAIFLTAATLSLTALIWKDYSNNREKYLVKAERNEAKPEVKIIYKDKIVFKEDVKTKKELAKVKSELKSFQQKHADLLRMYRSALDIIQRYKDFFANNNVCVSDFEKGRFEHYGPDLTVTCYFFDKGVWIKREAKAFKEYVQDRLP